MTTRHPRWNPRRAQPKAKNARNHRSKRRGNAPRSSDPLRFEGASVKIRRSFPTENAPNGDAQLLAKYDTVADPEDQVDPATGKADIDHFADFMRLLAPPPTAALSPSTKSGQGLFSQIGCTGCHEPTFVTGPNAIKALDRKAVALYSDLLLHDMGSLGDGIAQGTARTTEMKTPPLWCLHARGPFLHDGRASTISAAIRMHDGEAARARDRFNRLGSIEQQQLLAFLNAI